MDIDKQPDRLECCVVLSGLVEVLRRKLVTQETVADLIEGLSRKCGGEKARAPGKAPDTT